MMDASDSLARTPVWQQSIRARCAHPTGRFVPFEKSAVEQSIPERFQGSARTHADRPAIRSGRQLVSYRDLDRAANRVAEALLARCGERPEPIALLFDHGAPFVAAILGVLKAGKFYVPLDPAYPAARLRYMLEDSGASLVVTGQADGGGEAGGLVPPGCRPVAFEELAASGSGEAPGVPVPPDAPAYIIYTSGSTAQPKGVVQSHRNVLHKIMLSTNDYQLCCEDRRTLLYSPSSSGSVWEIFGGVLNGGSVHPFDLRRGGAGELARWLTEEDITIYGSVPTLFRHVMSTVPAGERFPRIRMVNLGGEAVTEGDVELFRRHFGPDCVLATTLAATETGTFRRYFVDHATRITGGRVPAGYPVDDKEVLVLDEQGTPVEPGEVGEIVVRGRYLSPGYWRRPELTRAAFVPDPADGTVMRYRTGDLGRLLPDGCLVYVGRVDSQVKVRGHRVELAEIEMALLAVDGVSDAVVVQREDAPGEPALVAYVVPAGPRVPTVSALRRALGRTLPGHMLPAAFVTLEALPLTPAGKVDRRALPRPAGERPVLDQPYLAPRTPVERAVTDIWASVLALDRVGIHDEFLDLGGHSLLATQIIARVIRTFEVDLPVRALFESPTVAEMAVVIVENQARRAGHEDVERMLAELEALSDEEARKRWGDRGA